jgi:D-alanyl-D-alanine carboxypeptidase
MKVKILFYLLLLVGLQSCKKNQKYQVDPIAIEATKVKIQKLMNDASEAEFPGFSLTVTATGYEYQLFAGKASLPDVKYSANTLNYACSISKTFTAVAILKLKERGLIDLNAPISRYLNPAIISNITNGNIITVKQLLNMTAGIEDFEEALQADVLTGNLTLPTTYDKVISYSYNKPAVFEPGTKQLYANINFDLLALIIEKVTQKNHSEFFINEIIKKYDLSQTFYLPQSNYTKAPTNTATGYTIDSGSTQFIDRYSDLQFGASKSLIGDDGFVSSTKDLAKFYHLLLQEKKVLSNESLMLMTNDDKTPLVYSAFPPYGLGLFFIGQNGFLKTIGVSGTGHSGNGPAAGVNVYNFSSKGVTVAFATNIDMFFIPGKFDKFNDLYSTIVKIILEIN